MIFTSYCKTYIADIKQLLCTVALLDYKFRLLHPMFAEVPNDTKKETFGELPQRLHVKCKSSVCKPSSVLNGYLSTSTVTDGFQRICRDAEQAFDLISCTEWGLHVRLVTKTYVGSYPAFPPLQRISCGIFLLHFP